MIQIKRVVTLELSIDGLGMTKWMIVYEVHPDQCICKKKSITDSILITVAVSNIPFILDSKKKTPVACLYTLKLNVFSLELFSPY
jgi:hypothetical protein